MSIANGLCALATCFNTDPKGLNTSSQGHVVVAYEHQVGHFPQNQVIVTINICRQFDNLRKQTVLTLKESRTLFQEVELVTHGLLASYPRTPFEHG